MLVKCEKAIPGKQYRTQRGVLVEISVGKEKNKYGHPLAQNEPKTGRVLVHRVDEQTKKVDYSTAIPIPLDYMLEDGLSKEESKKLHKLHVGRKPHADKTWRGWAFKNRDWPESILSLSKGMNLFIKPTANYFSLSWNGFTFGAVYRNGDLAFPKQFKNIHDKLSKIPSADFCAYRLSLKKFSNEDFVSLKSSLTSEFSKYLMELQKKNTYEPT